MSPPLAARAAESLRRARPLLGTLVEIQVDGAGAAALTAVENAFAAIAEVHRLMSFHEAGSDVAAINRGAHRRTVTVHPQTATVLRAALRISALSEGAFDISVGAALQGFGLLPGDDEHTDGGDWRDIALDENGGVRFRRALRVDLGGIAKGYAVDCAIEVLRAAGIVSALVNAGGDLRVLGTTKIGLRDPRAPERLATTLTLRDQALATSAAYFSRREVGGRAVSALFDPRRHAAYVGTGSISVVADSCMVADALTKVVLFASPPLAERVLAEAGACAYLLGFEESEPRAAMVPARAASG